MKRAFSLAFSNKRYISPSLAELLTSEMNINRIANPFNQLSHREFEIARHLLSSKSLSKIAADLRIKPSTVGTFKARIFEKLKIETIFQLKELAILYSFDVPGTS